MTDRRDFVLQLASLGAALPSLVGGDAGSYERVARTEGDREYWVSVLTRIARPVLENLAEGRLHLRMPVEVRPAGRPERREVTHLEALGRLLTGIAPWLELGGDSTPEGALRTRYAELARRSIALATNPRSPDYMNFTHGSQPLVDAAFLAHAVLRAPRELWESLDGDARRHLTTALASTRVIKPGFNNWLLFSAMIEAALSVMGEQWDRMRVDYALREHEQWYKGDGVYGDGPLFHWDYYNSFVIQPMPGTFDAQGWLTIGFAGHQLQLGESYISTGSLYLCAAGLLPLGLRPNDEFWTAPPPGWTAKRAWAGVDMPNDHAI